MSNSIKVGNVKVTCAIGHGLYEPWLSILREGQLNTWLAVEMPESFQVIHFHGTPISKIGQWFDRCHERLRWRNRYVAKLLSVFDNVVLFPLLGFIPKYEKSKHLNDFDNAIHIRFPDSYLTYRWKFLSLLKYFVEKTDSDYLLITSSASYIQPNLALNFIGAIPNASTYVGAEPYEGAGFISGSNRIISRRIAMQVLETRKKWRPGIIEDVELSRLITANGNHLQSFPIANISSIEALSQTTSQIIRDNYHFRLKSYVGKDRDDVRIMQALHSRVMQMKSEE
jgi:hypothetical protein